MVFKYIVASCGNRSALLARGFVFVSIFFFPTLGHAEESNLISKNDLGILLQEGFESWSQKHSSVKAAPLERYEPKAEEIQVQPQTLSPSLKSSAPFFVDVPIKQEITADIVPEKTLAPLEPEVRASSILPAHSSPPNTLPQESLDALISLSGGGDFSSLSSLKPDILDPLTLEEAVSYALKNNFEVLSMDVRSQGSRWDYAGAYAMYMPSIDFTFAQGAEKSEPGSYNDSSGGRVEKTTHLRRDKSFSVRQPLVDLVILADILKASNAVDLADAEKMDARESTVFATISTFLKLLQSRKTIELFDSYTLQLKDMATRMRARLEEGGATNADLDRIDSRLNTAEAAHLEALESYGSAIAELKRLTNVVPAQIIAPPKLAPKVPPTPQEALDIAWQSNPSYLAAVKKIDVAERDRDKSFAGALPKLSVEYSDTFTYNAGGAAHGPPIDGVYPNQKDERIMLVAKWNISGGTALTSGMSGVQKVQEMSLKAKDVRARIEQGIRTAYDGLNAARKRVNILKRNYETDQRVVHELEEQFVVGGGSLFEVLDSLDRLHQTRLALVNALFAEALSAYQIRMQMGEGTRAVLDGEAGHNEW